MTDSRNAHPYGASHPQQPHPVPQMEGQPYPAQSPGQYGASQAQGPQSYPQGPPPGRQQYQQGQPPGQYGGQPDQPPAKRKTGKTVLFVVLGLVVLLGLGGGTAWVVSGGFGGGLGESEWQVPFTTTGTEDLGTGNSIAFGAWMSETAAIRVQKDGVLAYDLNTGKRTWGTPSPGEQMCAATSDISGSKGVVAYGTIKACDQVAGIDVKTGELTWKVKIPAMVPKVEADATYVPVLMLAGDLVVVRTWGEVAAYQLSDGKRAWRLKASEGCSAGDAVASPKQVVVNLGCSQGGDAVVVLDAKTGKLKGEYRITDDDGGPDLLISADPVVAAWKGGDEPYILVLDDKGKKVREFETKTKISLGGMNDTIYIRDHHPELRAAVRENTLYLTTSPEKVEGGGSSRNEVVAFDLASGKQLWKSSGTGASMLTFVNADDKGLLLTEAGGLNGPIPRLVRIDTATGKATPVAELRQEAGGESGDARVYYRNGSLVIMPFENIAVDHAVTKLRVAVG